MVRPISQAADKAIDWLRLRRLLLGLANNLKLIIIIYVVSLPVAAVLFGLAEHRSFTDGLWWADVTALTIGYGDVTPTTVTGRIIAVVFQHLWIFGIAPLVIANLVIRVLRDDNEFSDAEQKWLLHAIALIAQKHGVELPPRPSDTDHGDVGN